MEILTLSLILGCSILILIVPRIYINSITKSEKEKNIYYKLNR